MSFDVDHIESLLQAAAAQRDTFSYSELLQLLGMGFSRPKMRALCAVLDTIDDRAAAAGQPELAALVVRESDCLPGQGWWVGRLDYAGAFEGAPARKYLLVVQRRAFDYWQKHQPTL
nr:ribose-phosphate pyrophosphokinase [Polymorphobacter sp.]